MTTSPLQHLRELLSTEAQRSHGTAPAADPFDPDQFPFGKAAGANKSGFAHCATCGKPPTDTGRNDCPLAFMFRDELSAKEYYISGMCQACQDSVFGG